MKITIVHFAVKYHDKIGSVTKSCKTPRQCRVTTTFGEIFIPKYKFSQGKDMKELIDYVAVDEEAVLYMLDNFANKM